MNEGEPLVYFLTAVCTSVERRSLGKAALPAKGSKVFVTIWKVSVAGSPKEVNTVPLMGKECFLQLFAFPVMSQ